MCIKSGFWGWDIRRLAIYIQVLDLLYKGDTTASCHNAFWQPEDDTIATTKKNSTSQRECTRCLCVRASNWIIYREGEEEEKKTNLTIGPVKDLVLTKKGRRPWWYFHYWADEEWRSYGGKKSLTDCSIVHRSHITYNPHTLSKPSSLLDASSSKMAPASFFLSLSSLIMSCRQIKAPLYFPFHLIKCFHVESSYTVREERRQK